MLFDDGERPPGVPDYYILTEEFEVDGGIVRSWRNPHPDTEEHEKGMRDTAEYLLECCLRHMEGDGKESNIKKLFGGEADLAAECC